MISILDAGAEARHVVGGVGHGLGAASDDNMVDAEHNVLGAEYDGLEGRGTHLIDSSADGGRGETSAEGALAGRALSQVGGQDVAEVDLLDIFGLDSSARDGAYKQQTSSIRTHAGLRAADRVFG
jgi:hypothetical protein